jgi:hypothetical protein
VSDESERCLTEAGIDKAKLDNCITNTDSEYKIYDLYKDKTTWLNGRYPKFEVQTDLNEQYGVQGSPTVVINDQIVNVSPRTPENFKETVCQTFNVAPEECSQTLSTDSPSPGIGEGTSSSNSGGCGQ